MPPASHIETPPSRPERVRVKTEDGSWKTLAAGPEAFDILHRDGAASGVLLLGLGGDVSAAVAAIESACPGATANSTGILWIEREDFAPDSLPSGPPPDWKRVAPENAGEAAAGRTVIAFRQNLALWPSFWGPVFARTRLAGANPPPGDVILLAIPENGLLRRELAEAAASLGLVPEFLPQDGDPAARAAALLSRVKPRLTISVNLRGLDPFGEVFHIHREAGVPLAVWCVDNPFHVVSGCRSDFWKDLDLFVTDDWFLAPLAAAGATRARHLPLASWPGFARLAQGPTPFDPAGRILFVGRSEFPDKTGFFAGTALPAGWQEAARAAFAAGQRPDLGWWAQRLGVPVHDGSPQRRVAGLAAEESGRLWRADCLRALADFPETAGRLTVVGDQGWKSELGPAEDVRPPVDYYGPLAALYSKAAATLNMTSPLLPRGLTQRHFDVWTAGGLLLTDATPGLSLFPKGLTLPVTFTRPEEIPGLLRRLEGNPNLTADLAAAWREHLAARHTYAHRLALMLDACG